MTREEWDAEFDACMARLRSKGAGLVEAQRLARDITTVRFGARPAGMPLTWRLALEFLRRKAKGSQMMQRILTSLGFALGVALPLYTAAANAASPGGAEVLGAEWAGIVYTALVSGYANFKSNTTILAPNRTEWTPEQRAVETAKMDAGVLVADAKVVAAAKVEDAKAVADAKVAR